MKKFLDDSGQIEIPLLFIIFLLFLVMAWAVRLAQDTTLADVNLKETVTIAVKAAAGQFEGDNEPVITPEAARQAFEKMLAANLELNPENLEPLTKSAWEKGPDYRLLIYNGTSGAEYLKKDRGITKSKILGSGFPATFELQDLKITLDSPGVIATVKMTARGIFGKGTSYERWAAARIIDEHDGSKVIVLQGKD